MAMAAGAVISDAEADQAVAEFLGKKQAAPVGPPPTPTVPQQTEPVSKGPTDDTVMIIGVILIIINFTIGGQFSKIIGVVWGGKTQNIATDMLMFAGEFVFIFILAVLANINSSMRGVAIALLLGLGLVMVVRNGGPINQLISKLGGK